MWVEVDIYKGIFFCGGKKDKLQFLYSVFLFLEVIWMILRRKCYEFSILCFFFNLEFQSLLKEVDIIRYIVLVKERSKKDYLVGGQKENVIFKLLDFLIGVFLVLEIQVDIFYF